MLKNYFKIAWRNLVKSKVTGFINIAGLAIGMAVAIMIGLWVQDELTFNQVHENQTLGDRLLRIWGSYPSFAVHPYGFILVFECENHKSEFIHLKS